ncbi:MAG: MMPL family transporter [Actinomycetes bacterium]
MSEPEYRSESVLSTMLSKAAGLAVANRRTVGVASVVVGLVFAAVAFVGLRPSAGTDSLVPKATSAAEATDRIRAKFGDDPIVVMAEENLQQLLLTTEIGRLLQLEGCLGGRVPKGAKPYGGVNSPCGRIARAGSVKRVYGPATFINEAANQLTSALGTELRSAASNVQRAADAARKQALAAGQSAQAAAAAATAAGKAEQGRSAAALARLQLQTGLKSLPSIANSDFVTQVAFDGSRGLGQPKARFSYLFPSSGAALIQVRPKAGLSDSAKRALTRDVEAATKMPEFQLKAGRYVVTGAGVLAESLATEVAAGAIPLLLAAAALMALALGLAFPVRARLLPLLLALLTAALVFGGMALFGMSLTVAAVGGVPVLIGLAVDYAVQLQARSVEALRREGGSAAETVVSAIGVGGPPVVTAALGTAAGFLALMLSPVPMVRGFGLVLIAGVAVALVCAVLVGSAGLSGTIPGSRHTARAADWLDSARLEARELIVGKLPFQRFAAPRVKLSGLLSANPGTVLLLATTVAIGGWAVEGQLNVESDITRLVPSGTPALQDLQALQTETGVAGEVDLLLTGTAVTEPRTLAWLAGVQKDVLARWGYSKTTGCKGSAVCPGVSLTDLVSGQGTSAATQAALAAVPEYFKSAVITPEGDAVLTSFGVKLMPLSKQQAVFDDLRSRAATAPSGVTASVGGLPVVAAAANDRLADADSRRLITLVALLLAAAVLMVAFRSWRRLAVPLSATALATGWATLALWILGVDLNPLSAALGALVIAIGTEFAVLLSERQRAESLQGGTVEDSLARAFSTTGRAIGVSGLTVVMGFGVLVLSDIRVLRDFGIATVVDLLVALLAVVIVVPAMVRVLERRRAGAETE